MGTVESPLEVVAGVSVELERISSLLNVLTQIQGNYSEIELTDFSNTIGVIRDCLDCQIKALDGIDWRGQA